MYCTLDDLKKQLPEVKLLDIASDDEAPGEIHQPYVDAAIEAAGAEIDAYAANQYSVPFAPVPKIIAKLAVDISIYHLFTRRGFSIDDESPDKIVLQRYKDAVKFLENLAKGVVSVGVAGAGGNAVLSPDLAVIQNPPRIFKRSTMSGY